MTAADLSNPIINSPAAGNRYDPALGCRTSRWLCEVRHPLVSADCVMG
jgi:hypothetical protein